MAKRRCFTAEIDPLYCEISIRRLEYYRATGLTGWQNGHAFETDPELKSAAQQGAEVGVERASSPLCSSQRLQ
ncbi:MAG: hypothetical protein HC889_10005 [Synechococcaceae cyanobacterium SM1_2_3]|nr:hypothetical protein [Synechococcaceae cyanobacterium SM1_2_3]